MYFKLSGKPLKLVDKFTYLSSNISFNKRDISIYLAKVWKAIDRLLIIRKPNLSDKMGFLPRSTGVHITILMHYMDTNKTQRNYTRMLHAVFNKSWKQLSTKQQLYGHLPPISNFSSKTNKTWRVLMEKQRQIPKWYSIIVLCT